MSRKALCPLLHIVLKRLIARPQRAARSVASFRNQSLNINTVGVLPQCARLLPRYPTSSAVNRTKHSLRSIPHLVFSPFTLIIFYSSVKLPDQQQIVIVVTVYDHLFLLNKCNRNRGYYFCLDYCLVYLEKIRVICVYHNLSELFSYTRKPYAVQIRRERLTSNV